MKLGLFTAVLMSTRDDLAQTLHAELEDGMSLVAETQGCRPGSSISAKWTC